MLKEEALFALAYSTGTILLLHLNIQSGSIQSSEIKQESIVPRFLSGLATAFRGLGVDINVSMSLVLHSYDNNFYLIALCREGRLRMWSCHNSQCIAAINLTSNGINDGIQNYGLKKYIDPSNDLYLCTYLKYDSKSEFCVLKLLVEDGIFTFNKLSILLSTDVSIIFNNTIIFINTNRKLLSRTCCADRQVCRI